jgi:hypothetical protein
LELILDFKRILSAENRIPSPDSNESPESQKLIFSCPRRATLEAPSWAWKNSFCDEDLE